MRVCVYVMRFAAHDSSAFEYHAKTHTYPYIKTPSLFIFVFQYFPYSTHIYIPYTHTHTQTCIWIPSLTRRIYNLTKLGLNHFMVSVYLGLFCCCYYSYYMGRVKRIWYLSPMRAAKVQASLHIRAVLPEPSLFAHTSSESRGTFRQKARSIAPLSGWACAVKICHDGTFEDTNSLDGAHIQILWPKTTYQDHKISAFSCGPIEIDGILRFNDGKHCSAGKPQRKRKET